MTKKRALGKIGMAAIDGLSAAQIAADPALPFHVALAAMRGALTAEQQRGGAAK